MRAKFILMIFTLITLNQALFDNTLVKQIEGDSLNQQLNNNLCLVVFHQNTLTSQQITTFEKTALALRNMINVANIDDNELSTEYGVTEYPTYGVFSLNNEFHKYEGEATAENLITFTFEIARNVPKIKVEEKQEAIEDDDDVIVLDDDNYNQIAESEDAWIVEFYADWCDHCKKLAPEWTKLGSILKGEIKVAKIDSSKNTKAHEKYKVKGYPSIKFFPSGEKLDGEWEDYDGSRDAIAMADWARQTKTRLRPLFLNQLISNNQFKQDCLEYNGICLVLFLPHILDSGKEGREQYLKTYKDAVLPHKQKPFNYFWSQGADQYDFEEQFGLGGAGYPSVLALSPKKQVWSKMRAQFNKENVDRFINNLIRGKEHVAPIRRLVEIKTVQQWVE